ncbi:flavin reductase (NADPH) [Hyalella azteca]|uniref:Flavin reductase (NADPH) n=1 Tax=Hyalella azteca TaxID=294128 RepID=A0A8B7NIW8_HYAAZ|nr:flavin reductase (NADPH) [Hyalella azteca]
MRIAIFGATGQTGLEAVAQALQKGYDVTAVVRNPDKLAIRDSKLTVVRGDVMDAASLTPLLEHHDAIVSCLGFPRASPVTGYTDSMKAIVEAMRKNNIRKLVTMTSWYTDTTTAANGGFFVNWLLVPLIKPVLCNMRAMETFLSEQCQDLDYTVVRPPGLGKGDLSGNPVSVTEEAYFVKGNKGAHRIPRADVASFMLSLLSTSQYNRKMIAMTTAVL